MTGQLLIAIISGVAYAIAAIAGYARIRHQAAWAPAVLRVGGAIGIGIEGAYLFRSIATHGLVGTFQYNFDAVLLLSMLIGLVAIGTHFSTTLKGLDGLLFVAASLLAFSDLAVIGQPVTSSGRPWFISHSLAFAVSATFFIAGGVAGVAYLLVNWMLRRKRGLAMVTRVPPLESLERFGRWMPVIGFPLFTFGILTGLCGVAHRKDLGARPWYLDVTFLSSIAAWAVYAYLSLSLMYRPQVRGRRAATLATYGLGLIVVAFLARQFLSPLHQ
jgi:ABC-type uncharacterized transport system permease subunit